MKKQLLILLSNFLLSISFAATVEISSVTVDNPSQIFTDVTVSFSSEKNFSGYQLTIQYNHQVLKILDVQKGPAVSLFTVMTNTNVPGIIRIAGFNPTLSGISGTGVLAILKFQIVNPGNSNLVLSAVKLSDATGQTIPCTGLSGYVRTGQASQQPEKTEPEPKTGETKPKEKPVPVPAKPVTKPEITKSPQKTPETVTPPSTFQGDIDIDELLMALEMEKPSEPKEVKKDVSRQKSGDTVTLLVFSDYGNPYPAAGVTTYTKGERVNCRVESEILLSDTEKVICIGCEGRGSAFNTKNNSISFIIERDSKIVWKWRKLPVEPGILIETQEEYKTSTSAKEISLPLKIRFLGGFDRPAYLKINSQNLDAVTNETWLTRNNKTFTLTLKKSERLPAGRYPVEIVVQSEDGKIKDKKNIDIIVYSYASLEDAIIDETTKTVKIPIRLTGMVKEISSFSIELKCGKTIKFAGIESVPNVKIFNGLSQKGNLIEVKGGLVPSIDINNGRVFNLVLRYSRKFSPDMIKITDFSLWNERGEPIPISKEQQK